MRPRTVAPNHSSASSEEVKRENNQSPSQELDDYFPSGFRCPITMELFSARNMAIQAGDDQIYSLDALAQMRAHGIHRSPLGGRQTAHGADRTIRSRDDIAVPHIGRMVEEIKPVLKKLVDENNQLKQMLRNSNKQSDINESLALIEHELEQQLKSSKDILQRLRSRAGNNSSAAPSSSSLSLASSGSLSTSSPSLSSSSSASMSGPSPSSSSASPSSSSASPSSENVSRNTHTHSMFIRAGNQSIAASFDAARFIHAAKCDQLRNVRLFYNSERMSINNTDGGGNTALHYAIANNNVDMVGFLLRYNADPMVPNLNHQNAIEYGTQELAKSRVRLHSSIREMLQEVLIRERQNLTVEASSARR